MHGSAPDGLVVLQIDARVGVFEQQFPAVAIIAVYYIDPRFSEISQAKQEPLLDFFKIARLDDVLAALLLVGEREHVIPDAELGRQERVDEGDVVVDAARL